MGGSWKEKPERYICISPERHNEENRIILIFILKKRVVAMQPGFI
jgi:hypothetical protein